MKSKKAAKQDAGVPFRAWAQPPVQGVVAGRRRMRRPLSILFTKMSQVRTS
jgi:hypothetical protein